MQQKKNNSIQFGQENLNEEQSDQNEHIVKRRGNKVNYMTESKTSGATEHKTQECKGVSECKGVDCSSHALRLPNMKNVDVNAHVSAYNSANGIHADAAMQSERPFEFADNTLEEALIKLTRKRLESEAIDHSIGNTMERGVSNNITIPGLNSGLFEESPLGRYSTGSLKSNLVVNSFEANGEASCDDEAIDGINKDQMDDNVDGFLKLKDRWLPLANVSKIMKSSVPEVAKIAKDAKMFIQHSASEFIAIVTCKAKDIAVSESRKVVTGDDLIKAMEELDLPYFSEITQKYFDQYKKTTNTYASLYLDQNNKY